MTSWSDLLPEILDKISRKFDFYEDFVNFLCVCSSWKSSVTRTRNFIQCLPSRFPALMLAESNTEDEAHDCCRFFLFSNGGTVRKHRLPEARWQRCISANGWLLTTGEEEFTARLIHPLSRTQIELPQLYMFEELYFDQDEWIYYRFAMRKAVFTSSNPLLKDSSFRVIIIWGTTIGFCRLGDVSWSQITGWEGHPLDITYHKTRKRLYVVATMGSLYECEILNDVSSPLNLCRLSQFPGKEFGRSNLPWAYVLEWGYNSLLLVTRERHYFKKHDDECAFQCFVFNLDDGKWLKLVNLGNKAIFLGFNSSFMIDAGGGVKPNCIYFTNDLYEPYHGLLDGGGVDVGIYHLSDGRIEAIFDSPESVFRNSPALWLQTSTLHSVKEI
uniref:putative F-box protein At5g55150 n=1 Tax=Erigeron canadensis TaxID=72917 RepID=UPI001CB8C5B1|nr:putative F-box protein At5g55150 [Erigeron canadensis]